MLSLTWIYVTIVIVVTLVTHVYLEVYRRPQERIVERLLLRYYTGSNEDDSKDVVSRRDKIIRLRRSMGVGIDSLPIVRFESGSTDIGKNDSTLVDEEANVRARRNECLSTGYYVGPDDDYVDCRSLCAVSDGVDYRYYDKLGVMLNGRKGRIGAYCMPNDAAACNTNTSLALYTKDGWRCVPQTRAFAGEGGNRIVVCDGSLLDRATMRVWRDHIDPTLTFESIDEKLPGGEFRFVCPSNITDAIGNPLIPAPFDRLLLLRNVCTMMIPYARTDDMYPDFENSRCRCGTFGMYERSLGTCLPFDKVDSEFDPKTLESEITTTPIPCVQTWSTISDMEVVLGKVWHQSALMPCGVQSSDDDTVTDLADQSLPACDKTYAFLYDHVVPSPYMMLEASGKIRRLKSFNVNRNDGLLATMLSMEKETSG